MIRHYSGPWSPHIPELQIAAAALGQRADYAALLLDDSGGTVWLYDTDPHGTAEGEWVGVDGDAALAIVTLDADGVATVTRRPAGVWTSVDLSAPQGDPVVASVALSVRHRLSWSTAESVWVRQEEDTTWTVVGVSALGAAVGAGTTAGPNSGASGITGGALSALLEELGL